MKYINGKDSGQLEIFSLEQAIEANNEVRLIDFFAKSIDLEQVFRALAPFRKQAKRFSGHSIFQPQNPLGIRPFPIWS
jgi:predicted HAD superfamily phosphohydrolase YqeG